MGGRKQRRHRAPRAEETCRGGEMCSERTAAPEAALPPLLQDVTWPPPSPPVGPGARPALPAAGAGSAGDPAAEGTLSVRAPAHQARQSQTPLASPFISGAQQWRRVCPPATALPSAVRASHTTALPLPRQPPERGRAWFWLDLLTHPLRDAHPAGPSVCWLLPSSGPEAEATLHPSAAHPTPTPL